MKRSTFALGLNSSVILQQILPLANKTTDDDYLTSNIFLFHLLIYSLRDEGILLEIIGTYRSLQSLLFAFLFIRFFFVYKGCIRFPDTDRQQSSETRELFALGFSSYTVQMSYETSN